MRIVLVGPPSSGKDELSKRIEAQLGVVREERVSGPYGSAEEFLLVSVVGPLIDYRHELALALARAMDMLEIGTDSNHAAIFTGTVIDSMAHCYTNIATANRAGSLNLEDDVRWSLTAALIYAILVDSFKSDLTFLLPGEPGDELGDFYEEVLHRFKIPHVKLTDPDPENRVKIVLAEFDKLTEANGTRHNNGDTEQENAQ